MKLLDVSIDAEKQSMSYLDVNLFDTNKLEKDDFYFTYKLELEQIKRENKSQK